MNKSDRWIIDSGCSNFMIANRSKFENFGPNKGSYVKFGNDVSCIVKCKWSIQLIDKIKCANVYWVEGLNYTLLSVLQLNKQGYKVEFHHRKTKIFDVDGKLIGSGDQTRCNLLYLDLSDKTCLFAQYEDIWLWNKRLCHVIFNNLVSISKVKRVRGLPKLKKPDNTMCKQS